MNLPRKPLVPGLLLAGSALLLTGLSACSGQNAAPPPAANAAVATLPDGLKPAASVLDIMNEMVVPLSNTIWMADDPSTDEQWSTLRAKALMLMEASNLLAVDGRVMAHEGQQLKEPGGEGDYTPAQAQEAMDKERAVFTAMASALQSATQNVLAAIDKKDADAYLDAGGNIDEACESCHTRFWYPNGPKADE